MILDSYLLNYFNLINKFFHPACFVQLCSVIVQVNLFLAFTYSLKDHAYMFLGSFKISLLSFFYYNHVATCVLHRYILKEHTWWSRGLKDQPFMTFVPAPIWWRVHQGAVTCRWYLPSNFITIFMLTKPVELLQLELWLQFLLSTYLIISIISLFHMNGIHLIKRDLSILVECFFFLI